MYNIFIIGILDIILKVLREANRESPQRVNWLYRAYVFFFQVPGSYRGERQAAQQTCGGQSSYSRRSDWVYDHGGETTEQFDRT